MKKKNAVALGLFLTMAMSMPASAIDLSNSHRIDGSDRIQTSLKSAEMVNSKVLVLASGYSYADSLSASNVVFKTGGKLVLVNDKTDVESMFKKDTFEKIYIVGGESTVGKSVEESAKKICKDVVRISGSDRYATNEETLKKFDVKDVGVADGGNYPDALSASTLLKDKNLGLLLVNGQKPYKTDLNVKYTFGYSVKQDGGKRLAGRDRYATNEAVLKELGNKDDVALASGNGFPDALSATNLVTAKDAAIVLLNNSAGKVSKNVEEYIQKSKNVYILGGTSTLSNNIVKNAVEGKKEDTPVVSSGSSGGGSRSNHYDKNAAKKAEMVKNADDYLEKNVVNPVAEMPIVEKFGAVEFNKDTRTTTVTINEEKLEKEIKPEDISGIKDTGFIKNLAATPNLVGYKVENGENTEVVEIKNDPDTFGKLKENIIKDVEKALNITEGTTDFKELNDKTVKVEAYYKDKDGVETTALYTFNFLANEEASNKMETKKMVKAADKYLAKDVVEQVDKNSAVKKFGSVKFDDKTRTTTITIDEKKLEEKIKPEDIDSIKDTKFIVNLAKTPNLVGYTVVNGANTTEVKITKEPDTFKTLKENIIKDVEKALNITEGTNDFKDLNGKTVEVNAHYNDGAGHDTTVIYTFNFVAK